MKKLVVALMIGAFGFANAQTDAFKGSGDLKAQVGANFQKWGTGIQASLDYGLGESFSIGAVGGYVLGFKEFTGVDKPSADQRFDLKARASAHLGDVIGLPQNVDVYHVGLEGEDPLVVAQRERRKRRRDDIGVLAAGHAVLVEHL